MKEPLIYFLERKTPLGALARLQRQRQLRKKLRRWEKSGGACPMPKLGKQQVVIGYIKKFSPEVFIETGTYRGKMIYAVMPYMSEIYSIELDPTHFRNAARRFAGYRNIHVIQGESGRVLPEIIRNIDARCLFWLDAHFSGGSTAKGDLRTPIMQEIECILQHKRAAEHIVLIDDARLFVGRRDYPTLQAFKEFVLNIRPGWVFEVENDIIRTHSNAK